MELDQEKQNQEAAERCRALAQRIVRELAPRSVQVLENSGLLEEAFDKMNTTVVQSSPELLVVADPQWVTLPAVQAEKVVLVCDEYTGMADCAKQLAAQGFCREFAWKDSGKEQLTALFCRTAAPELPELETGYEQQLDILRERTVQAERTAAEQAAQLERLRSDLSLSRSHEQDLEKTLNSVVNSPFWRASWPLRYLVSKCRQLWRSFPLFVFFATLRRVGFAGVMAQAKAKKEYKKLFPGKAMPADRFADVELLVKQAADQPAAPRISIVVPLYNTPHDFLVELLDSVQNQTYRNWELCMVDAGQDADVGVLVQERARTDSRIRYRKLDSNEGIAGNTNQGFALATGEYIALLDHDDILHPCALWYVAEAIAKQGADFVYTDEVTFEGDIDHLTVYHFKPDYMLDNLRSNNYICHLSVFSAALLAKVGGDERAEFNGSQDYDLYLRLTEQAEKIVHIPHLLYYWRSSPASVASNISAKTYCLEAAMKALRAHYDRMGVPVDAVTMVPNTPGFYKTDYTITKPGRVSVLIPSCDHSGDLRVCVESIYRKTTYPDFEVIIIENNSKEAATFRCYEQLQKEYPDTLHLLTWQGTGFNYSALNNFGAKAATGEYLLLLNNDTEVITPGWLEEMVMYAQQKRVGCVGAKLLYPDDTIQHAGVGFGIGSDFRLLLSGLLLQCRHLFLQFSQFFRVHGAGSLCLVQLLAQFVHLLRLASRLGANFVEKRVGHLHFLLVFGGDALHLCLHRRVANSTRLHLHHLQLVLKRFLLHFKVLNVAFKRSNALGEGVVASLERTALVLAVFQAFAQRRIVGASCDRHIAQVRRQHRGDVVDQCAWHLSGASRSRLTNSLLHLFLRRLLLRLFHSLVLTARHDALLHLCDGRRRRLHLLACRFHTLHGRFAVVAFGWRCIVSKRIDIG